MEYIIYKLEIPECSDYAFEVGKKGVIKIEEDFIQTGVGDGYISTAKMIYRIIFDNGNNIEISANVSGIVLFKQEKQ